MDLILKDIESLENLPNDYEERAILSRNYDATKGREGMEYLILDRNNLTYNSNKESSQDSRGLRKFYIKKGKITEIIIE